MESAPYFKSEAMDKVVSGIILVVIVEIMMIKFFKENYYSNVHIYNSLKYHISKLTIILDISLFCLVFASIRNSFLYETENFEFYLQPSYIKITRKGSTLVQNSQSVELTPDICRLIPNSTLKL
jgi:hypothetical protein